MYHIVAKHASWQYLSFSRSTWKCVNKFYIYFGHFFAISNCECDSLALWNPSCSLYSLHTQSSVLRLRAKKSYRKKWDSSHFSRALLQIRNWLETAALHFLHGFSDWHLFSTRTRITSNGPSSNETKIQVGAEHFTKAEEKTRIR